MTIKNPGAPAVWDNGQNMALGDVQSRTTTCNCVTSDKCLIFSVSHSPDLKEHRSGFVPPGTIPITKSNDFYLWVIWQVWIVTVSTEFNNQEKDQRNVLEAEV